VPEALDSMPDLGLEEPLRDELPIHGSAEFLGRH